MACLLSVDRPVPYLCALPTAAKALCAQVSTKHLARAASTVLLERACAQLLGTPSGHCYACAIMSLQSCLAQPSSGAEMRLLLANTAQQQNPVPSEPINLVGLGILYMLGTLRICR